MICWFESALTVKSPLGAPMSNALFLAMRYLSKHRLRSLIVVFGLGIVLFLPLFSYGLSQLLSDTLLQRGRSSPILIGHKGNEFDLTMNALYFRAEVKDSVPMQLADDVHRAAYGVAVPLYIKHSAGGAPLVGTSLEYFGKRELGFREGRSFAVLGEIVVGSELAESHGFSVGDSIRSDAQNLYNIAGSYPMMLTVVGTLEPSNTPDDRAIFTDVKTIWTLDGHFHGHEAVTAENSIDPADSEDENLEATAAIFMFQDFDPEKVQGFHIHGDMAALPLSSILVFPDTQKHHDQLLGDYASSNQYQSVRPIEVVQTILGIVLRLQEALTMYFGVILIATTALLFLIFQLSFRLRKGEFHLMERMGGSRFTIRQMVLAELGVLLIFAVGLAWCMSWFGLFVVARVLQ